MITPITNFFKERKPRRFAKKHAKWLLPVIGLISMASLMAVAANIPIPAGSSSGFVPGVPTAPTISSITSLDGRLSVAFTAASPNGGTISMYQYSTDNGATWKNRASGTTATPLIIETVSGSASSLVNGTAYTVRLRAVSNIGQGLASGSTAGTPAAVPTAPTIQSSATNFDTVVDVRDSVVQDDGKIIIVGKFTYTSSVFNNGSSMIRLNRDGTMDTSFNVSYRWFENFNGVSCDNGTLYAVDIGPDGKIYVGGDYTFVGDPTACSGSGYGGYQARIARFNTDGTLDTSFNPIISNGIVYDLEVMTDGSVVVGGSFTTVNSVNGINRIVVLNSDGTTNTNFNSGGSGAPLGSVVYTVAVNPLNRDIYVGGTFTSMNGQSSGSRLAHFVASGTSATAWTFNLVFNPAPSASVFAIEFTPDGSLFYVGGSFTTISSQSRTRLASYVPTSTGGTLQAFAPSIASGTVNTIDVQRDGKILIGGSFNALYRFETSGTLDSGFSSALSASGVTNTVSQLPFNEVYAGGNFTTIAGATRTDSGILESTGAIDDGVTWRYNGSSNVDGAAYVKFAAPSSNGGTGVSLQNYEYSTNGGSTWTAFSPAVTTATNATITGLSNGTSYTIALRAKNTLNSTQGTSSNGYGAASNNATAATMCSVPSAASFTIANSTSTTAPSGFQTARGFSFSSAPSATNNGCAISYYQYSSAVDGGTRTGWTGVWSTASPTGATTNTSTGRPLLTQTAYDVVIRGVNAAGVGASSSVADFTTTPAVTCTAAASSCFAYSTATFSLLFVSETTSLINVNASGDITRNVIGGGGGGGATSATTNAGGGGGGGGVVESSFTYASGITLTATIGAGGAGLAAKLGYIGSPSSVTASNSTGTVIAAGGGYGGGSADTARPSLVAGTGGSGGSGGGGSASAGTGSFLGGAATAGQGNAGGNGPRTDGSPRQRVGGGGGGIGSAGSIGLARSSPYLSAGGNGGNCVKTLLSLAYNPADWRGFAAGGGGADSQNVAGTGAGGSCGSGVVGGNRATATTPTGLENGNPPYGVGGNSTTNNYNFGLGNGNIYGSGSGGGGSRSGTGGGGSKGIVVLYWAKAL